MRNILADTGALVGWFDRSDSHHRKAKDFFARFKGNLLTTWPVVTEVCHLLPTHAVKRFMSWAAAGGLVIFELPGIALPQIADLMDKYRDHPMDLADASLVWLSGQIGVTDIVTVDRGGFEVYRNATGKPFNNLLTDAEK